MVRFRVAVEVAAPASYVESWWTDYRADDATRDPEMEARSVSRLDPSRVRVVTDLRYGRTPVRSDGIVTLGEGHRWRMEGEITVRDRPFGHEDVEFNVVESGKGSRLQADFHFAGKGPVPSLLLMVLRHRLRRGREEAYQGYARQIAEELSHPEASPDGARRA